jgi:steroid delta-isomerase-like uncharacterized protein
MQEEEQTQIIPEMIANVRAGKMARRTFLKSLRNMGITATGVAAIAAAASQVSASQIAPQVKIDESPEMHLQRHDQHILNQSQGNTTQLYHDYAPHAIVEDSMFPEPFVGSHAIMARKNVGMAAIADLQITITNRVVHGNQISAEWTATGTHTGDLPGMPATGRSFTLHGVTVTQRHGGKIVRESLYYDVESLRNQLGPGPR